ncbi:MAG: helix-turn-helix domain-containing protein, partial [Mangrovibacterium sp.]
VNRPSAPAMNSYNLKELEKKMIHAALKKNGYNQTAAADLLGITRDSLIRKMKKYGIAIKKNDTMT